MNIKNPDFENETSRETFNGQQFPELEGPDGWIMWWIENGDFKRPEMKVIHNQPPYIDPQRVYSENKALQFFGFYKRVKAGYYQQVNVGNAQKVTFSIYVHAWYSMRDNAHKSEWQDSSGQWHTITNGNNGFTISIGIDKNGGTDPLNGNIVWKSENIYDTYSQILLTVDNIQNETITVFIKGEADFPFKHCDCYVDLASLELHQNQSCNCICPEFEYEKTYHLLPQNAPLWAAKQVSGITYPTKGTMGYSTGDAGIGPQVRNVVAYWPDENAWQQGELEQFFNEKYPGVNLTHVLLYDTTNPPNPDPDPEPPKEIELRSNNKIGLHSGYQKSGWDSYLQQALPTIQKCFSCGFALEAKQKAPNALIVWRRHSDNDVQCYEPAQKLVDLYDTELTLTAQGLNLTREQLLDALDGIVIESLNEQIPTHNINQLQCAVNFDKDFCYAVKQKFNGKLRPGILTAAIGNPHETEVHYMIPAVQAAIETNGILGPHSYWTANSNQDYLIEHWKYHAGRFTEWDKVFNENGLYPEYFLGEGGIVFSTTGTDFHSGKGWKSCGSFEKYLDSISQFNELITQWNSSHNNRCHGITLFGYGNWGWDDFEIGAGDLELLKSWALTIL